MPRVKRTRKEREGFLVKQLLTAMGYRVSCPKWAESPDAFVTVSKGNESQRIGIEHTDYYSDTVAGMRSPLTPIAQFWEMVQASLVRRVAQRKQLTGIETRVRLQANLILPENPLDRSALARELAGALVAFAETHLVEEFERCPFRRPDFQQIPALQSMVTSLLLSRVTKPSGFASRCDWICSNISTGGISLFVDYVKSAVAEKNKKAPNYSRNGTQELWLVIAAAGDTVSNHAGPFSESDKLADSELATLCRSSPFDRIIFWERVRCWYKWLKPDRPAEQYRSPYTGRNKESTESGDFQAF